MEFNGWYVPRSGTSQNKAEIRISKNFISVSKYCIENYFKDKTRARVGYDKETNRLIIMPTDEGDKLGLGLVGKEDANYKYLNAKSFIEGSNLEPPAEKKSIKYDCEWDEENKWIIVNNVK